MKTRRFPRGFYAPELLEARIAPATFTVTNLFGDNADGSLRKAINDANASPGADTIAFKLADPLLPHTITLDFANGEILIKGPLTIKGPGIDLLTVSGADMMRIFNIDDGVPATLSPTTISGLTLTDGKAADFGGAIYSVEPLVLKNVVVRSSYAGNRGGGVFVETDGKTSIVNSRIVHNEAGNGGGGLYLNSAAGVSIVKTTIASNTADKNGGLYAIALGSKAAIVVDASLISGNSATAGGAGGARFAGANDGKITVKNSLVTGNAASMPGGGLYIRSGSLVVAKTILSNNTALSGGGLLVNTGAAVSISGSGFLGNNATDAAAEGGGGIFFNAAGTVAKIAGSVFSGNTARLDGGAIGNVSAITLSIGGTSFLGNDATVDGGAIALGGGATLTVTGSIFSANTAADDGGVFTVTGASVLTMKGSVLSGNAAGDNGGVLFAQSGETLTLTGNKFTENQAADTGGALFIRGAVAVTANLTGNLFRANTAFLHGGAVSATDASVFTSKGDKFIGNVALTGQGGGVHLAGTGGIFVTGSLFQGNVAVDNSGGGLLIGGSATLTGVKVIDNIAGPGGRGGGLRIGGVGVNVVISKSVITGNVANDGGGIFFDLGTTTLDAVTKVIGNAAVINPNIGNA